MALATKLQDHLQPAFPRVRSLDIDQVEIFYDVDLDEFTVLFYGSKRRHSLKPIGENAYALVDPKTGDLLGIELHAFMKKLVPRDPVLASAMPLATIISDEPMTKRPTVNERPQSLFDHLYDQWKRIATPRRAELRELLGSLRSLNYSEIGSQP